MKDYGPKTFGELNAENYDAQHDPGTTDEAVALLAELIGHGKALELAIGTGRVALPLAERGVDIHGIEVSPEMVAKLREKPGGDKIPVTLGDMAETEAKTGAPFDFAFLIFNTLFNLTSQGKQIACFKTTADQLKPGGAFLIETHLPDIEEFTRGQRTRTRHVGFDSATLEAAQHDPVNQVINYQIIAMGPKGTHLTPLPMRYAWPAEIDLMAKLAGLELETRWDGWDRTPFTGEGRMHISLYRKPA